MSGSLLGWLSPFRIKKPQRRPPAKRILEVQELEERLAQATFSGATINIIDNTPGTLPSGAQLYLLFQANGTYYSINNGVVSDTAPTSPTLLSSLPTSSGMYQLSLPMTGTITQYVSARLYFTTSSTLITQPAPGPNDFYYDFIEPTITSAKLNVDTTQVDQFAIPLSIQVQPNDPTFTQGSGIQSGATQADVFDLFQAQMVGPYAAFQDSIITSSATQTPQLLAPYHVIDNQFNAQAIQQPASSQVVVAPAGGAAGAWLGTLTISGGWDNSQFKIGDYVSGPFLPPGVTVHQLSGSDTVTVKSTSQAAANPFISGTIAPTVNGTGINLVPAPTGGFTSLASWFGPAWGSTTNLNSGNAIDDFFKRYLPTANGGQGDTLYLEDNGGPNGIVLYSGVVTTKSVANINGGTSSYTVLQFTAGSGGTAEEYNIFYPYFTTNSPVGKVDPFGNDVPPPPSYYVLPNLPNYIPPSEMIFGAAGVFADNAYQPASLYPGGNSSALADLERDVAASLIRGNAATLISTSDTGNSGSALPTFTFNPGSTTDGVWKLTSTADQALDLSAITASNFSEYFVNAFKLLDYPMQLTAAPTKNGDGSWSIPVHSVNGTVPQPPDDNLLIFTLYGTGTTFDAYSAFFQSRGGFVGLNGQPLNIYGRAYGDPYSDYMDLSSDLNSTPDPSGATQQTAILTVTLHPWKSAQAIQDGSFETPVVAGDSGKFRHDPTDNPWTWANINNEGIAANGSAYTSGNPNAPEGTQVAYIQKTGSVAQTFTVTAADSYALTFFAAQRAGNAQTQTLQLYVNGNAIGGPITPVGGNYAVYTTEAFALSVGSHTIALKGVNPQGGDNTALIDVVKLVKATNDIVQDPGFETPVVAGDSGKYRFDPTGIAWAWANGDQGSYNQGIAANGSAYTVDNPNAPQGTQVAFIQRKGSVTQTVNLPAGTYEITFYAAQRQQGAFVDQQELLLFVDGKQEGAPIKPSGAAYEMYTSTKFTLAAGSHSITFQGTQATDNTAFLDLVTINTVPAPKFDDAFISWTKLDGFVQQIATAINRTGQVQVFGIGGDNALWYRTQNPSNAPDSFGPWTSLGGFVKQFTVGQNLDGTLQVFAIGGDNAAWTNREVNGTFTGWSSLGGYVKQLTVARNADHDLELFAIGGDNALWRKVQVQGTTFGAWTSLGGFVKQIVAAANADHSVQVFAIGGDNALYTNKQTAPGGGGFNGWQALGGFVKQIAVGANLDGALQVFAIGGDNAAWTRKQTSGPSDQAAGFTAWANLGGFVKQLAVGAFGDGTLGLFAIGGDNAAWARRQSAPGGSDHAGFTPFISYGGFVKQLVVDRNGITKAAHFFAIGGDNALYTRGQNLPNTFALLAATEESGAALLTDAELQSIAAAARARLSPGLDAAALALLNATHFELGNLPPGYLSLAFQADNRVVVDLDAAGHGWFVDPTPFLDEEFVNGVALLGGPADDKFDLLYQMATDLDHIAKSLWEAIQRYADAETRMVV